MEGREETPFLIKTLILMSKFSMEACLQMSYEFVVQIKEKHILSYHVQKRQKVLKKIYFFYISKFIFQNGL